MNIRLFVRPPAHLAVLLVAYQACFPNIITSPKRKQRIISPLLYNNSMQTLHSLLDKHLSTLDSELQWRALFRIRNIVETLD